MIPPMTARRIFSFLELTLKVAMDRVALFFEPLTRREEGAYPLRSVTDEQQSQRLKKWQPFGPGYFGLPASSLTRHVASPMLLARLLASRAKFLPARSVSTFNVSSSSRSHGFLQFAIAPDRWATGGAGPCPSYSR